jgi:hypothetical protein
MSGFNPTLTIQALAYMSADAIVNRYNKNSWITPVELARAQATGSALKHKRESSGDAGLAFHSVAF